MSTEENVAAGDESGVKEPEAPTASVVSGETNEASPEGPQPGNVAPAPAAASEAAPADAGEAGPPKRPWYEAPEWADEPGDDVGNRVGGARSDDGNRAKGGDRKPPPGPRPAAAPAKHDTRAARPAAPPPAAPVTAASEEAAPPAQAAEPAAQAAEPAAQASDSASQAAEAAPAEGAAEPAEGDAPAEAGAEGAAGEAGAPTKKRRRRRRRKPGGAAGASSENSGSETQGEASGEAAEGEEGAEGDEEQSSPGAAAGAQGAQQPRKERGKKRRGPPPGRERPAFGIGEEVFGKVAKVTEHAVWIDIAGKAMGLFDRRELTYEEPPAEGDQFLATVSSNGVRGGMLMLSQVPAEADKSKVLLEAAAESGDVVEGFVTGAVKGGLEVDLGGVRAFAPASHVDARHGADLTYLVGQRLDFFVAQYAKKGRDVVVSRKKILEEEMRSARSQALAHIEAGSVHKGIVRTVVQWGAFVALPDAGGVEGLVHMSEASHDRGAKLNDLFKPGAEIEVKVLRVDERGKLWLSRKAVEADPWDAVKQKYAVGSRHTGTVARLQPFGVFIELEPGIDGLCHTADLSLKPIDHPNEVVKEGDSIDVVVATCESASRRIGLHPAPPAGEEDEPRQRVQQYKQVKVVVAQIIEGGLIVRILGVTGRQARAFIPAGHTGTPRGTDLRKEFPVGTRIDTKVLEIDPRRGEAKLSIRALKEDAEKHAYQQYRAGVARDSKFGTFADLLNKK